MPPAAERIDTAPTLAPAPDDAATDRVDSFAGRALGSALRLFVRSPAASSAAAGSAAEAWDAVCTEFEAVDLALSRFRDDSELTALNRVAGTGGVAQVSWRLRETIAAMDRARRITGGRFDATMALDLERLGEIGARLRPGTLLDGASAAADRPRPVIAPAVPLDSGGLGKGLALRWAARRALATLPSTAGLLLDAGGDVLVAGVPPVAGWRVGIEDPVAGPEPDTQPIAVVEVHDGALATSSIRVRHWTSPDGRAVHHLLDPRTREPARTGLLAVTVAGPDAAWAEVWTKALFLAGRASIADEARARGLAAWWVAEDGCLGMTPAARERSAWVAESRLG
ncbi:MAG: FAD:protein FMN transferase [Candidatus Limnocylindrales bacterium]